MIPAIFAHTHFNPLDPKIKIGILICCPDLIPTEVSGEKLIISSILCDHVRNSHDHPVLH